MSGKIKGMYFSPTCNTQKIVRAVVGILAQATGKGTQESDLTMPAGRGGTHIFEAEDVLVFGFPVYGGRIPGLLAGTLEKLQGAQTPAALIATYGNRDYEDALLEAQDRLKEKDFLVIAAGAFIGEHSYSRKLAAGRPDTHDMATATRFSRQAADKLLAGNLAEAAVKGKRPYRDPMPARPFMPKTRESCTDCKICVQRCPVGIISLEDPKCIRPGCLQCWACVKSCPVGAKYFDSELFGPIIVRLESNFMARKEPEIFI